LPPWEGPYIIIEVKPDTYKIEKEKGEVLTSAWNIQQLHHFYP
jgi:hypothetical protein